MLTHSVRSHVIIYHEQKSTPDTSRWRTPSSCVYLARSVKLTHLIIMTPRSPILSRQLAVGEMSEVGSAQPLSSSRGTGANGSIKTSPATGDEVSGHVVSSSKPTPQSDGSSDAKVEDLAQVNGWHISIFLRFASFNFNFVLEREMNTAPEVRVRLGYTTYNI